MEGRNKALIATGILLLVAALAAFLVGGYISGWDFAAFLVSPTAIWIYAFVGLYLFAVLAFLIYDRITKL